MRTIDWYDKAMRRCTIGSTEWRMVNRAGAAIRDGATVFAPYRFRILRLVPRRYRARAWRFVRGPYRHD